MFMVCVEAMSIISTFECNVVQESPYDIWYLASGCSNHMIGNPELFSSLDKSSKTKVTLGGNIQVIVLGKGNNNILTKQGEKKFMPNVYYVSILKHNLMSMRHLLQKRYRIYMEDNHCVILDRYPSNRLITRIHMTINRMFPLTLNPMMKRKKHKMSMKQNMRTLTLHLKKKVKE